MNADDKYMEMAKIAGPVAGMTDAQLPGLAHVFRSLAKDERRAAYKRVKDGVLLMRAGWKSRAAMPGASEKDRLIPEMSAVAAEQICEEIDCFIEDGK